MPHYIIFNFWVKNQFRIEGDSAEWVQNWAFIYAIHNFYKLIYIYLTVSRINVTRCQNPKTSKWSTNCVKIALIWFRCSIWFFSIESSDLMLETGGQQAWTMEIESSSTLYIFNILGFTELADAWWSFYSHLWIRIIMMSKWKFQGQKMIGTVWISYFKNARM